MCEVGGRYSNQVASLGDKIDVLLSELRGRGYMIDAEVTELEHQVDRLEFKVDNLVLDVRKFSDKLDMIKTAFDRSFDIELDVLPERKLGIEKQCKCGNGKDEVYGKSPSYTAFEAEKDRQAGINTLTPDEVA